MPSENILGMHIYFKKHPTYRHKKSYYSGDMLQNRIKQSIKTLSGGKSGLYYPPYEYSNNTKQIRPNVQYSQGSPTPTAQKGYHWQKGSKWSIHRVMDYENSDIFNDFDGNFYLEKIGNKFHCWIDLVDAQPIDRTGQPDSHHFTNIPKIVEAWYTDEDHSKSFTLATIAAYFAKHNIFEDQNNHVYHDVNMGCGAVRYWNIIDGGNDLTKPHIIAHAGETIIINTGKMKVYKADGTDLSKYTSFESLFPPIYGGQINRINFYPTVGKDCDLIINYVPRIK